MTGGAPDDGVFRQATAGDALRSYERLGFIASHEGMKLHLHPHTEPTHEE